MAQPAMILSKAELEEMLESAAERGARKVLEGRSDEVDWLDTAGVATLLKINVRSVTKCVTRSGLPAHRIGLRLYRFKRAEVEAWIAANGRK